MAFKLSIVIPVYNEVRYIDKILERVYAVKFQDGVEVEYIAVDDFSTDNTYQKLQLWEANRGLRLVRHEFNKGKGAALRTGFAMASGDATVVQDADFEYNPEELPSVLQPILDDKADVVFTARTSFLNCGSRQVTGYWHSVINRFLTFLSNMFSNLALDDMECCYKMVKRDFLTKIKLVENRFGFEPEFTMKISRLHPRAWQVPVTYTPRTYEEGKKINWKDGVSALRCILVYGLFRR